MKLKKNISDLADHWDLDTLWPNDILYYNENDLTDSLLSLFNPPDQILVGPFYIWLYTQKTITYASYGASAILGSHKLQTESNRCDLDIFGKKRNVSQDIVQADHSV